MKNFLPTFVAVLLAAGLALFVYDRYVLAPRLDAAGEAARINLAEAREQAQGIASELDASVERSVADAKAALDEQVAADEARRAVQEDQAEQMRLTAQAADALMRASMLKAGVAEFYMNSGDWPASLADLGMGKPADYEGGAVASITLEPGGVVAITIKPEVAAGARLRLVPQAKPTGMIDWSCRASDYPAAERISACRP